MSDTFDWEPEDSWDANDSMCAQIDNVLKRLDLLDHASDSAGRWRPFLVDIEHRLRPYIERADTGQLPERDVLRVMQLVEDVEFLRDRDDNGL